MSTAPRSFFADAIVKSSDLEHRATHSEGMLSYDAAVAKGKSRFADWEAARTRCAAIKAEGIANLATISDRVRATYSRSRRPRSLGRECRAGQ